jgi:hypothetical protein
VGDSVGVEVVQALTSRMMTARNKKGRFLEVVMIVFLLLRAVVFGTRRNSMQIYDALAGATAAYILDYTTYRTLRLAIRAADNSP